MSMKKIKYAGVIIVMIALVITILPLNKTAFAAEERVLATYTYGDGITRNLISKYEDFEVSIYLEDMFVMTEPKEIGFDRLGTIWFIREGSEILEWRVKNPMTRESSIFYVVPKTQDYNSYYNNVEALVYDEEGFVEAFKTTDGEIHPTLTLDEQNVLLIAGTDEPTYDLSVPVTPTESTEPQVTDSSTPTIVPKPTTKTEIEPVATSVSVSTEVPIVTPTSEKVPSAEESNEKNPSIPSIKKENGYNVFYKGDEIVNKYKLKSGVLTGATRKKVKKVKSAGFIKKSGKIIFLTKSGAIGTLTKKGKKKIILAKGAKKFVKSDKFVVKVKKKNGKTMSVKNK